MFSLQMNSEDNECKLSVAQSILTHSDIGNIPIFDICPHIQKNKLVVCASADEAYIHYMQNTHTQ